MIITVLVIGLCGLSPAVSHRATEDTEILVIDLSKRLSDNPYQQEYEQMLYPTVRIKTPTSTGSGVIFTAEDAKDAKDTIYILTAAHVVGEQSEVTVEVFYPNLCPTGGSSSALSAFVVMTDTNKDLALLRALCASAVNSSQLAPESYTPYLFTPVWAVGCSLGLTPRPSQGIITYISDFSVLSGSYWEISSPILPGNSGGPVYAIVPSDDGNASTYAVIGIAVWVHTYKNQIVTTMAGIVPIQDIYTFLESVPTE